MAIRNASARVLVCAVLFLGLGTASVEARVVRLDQAGEIYQALRVQERDPSPGVMGAVNSVKEIGGLSCRKIVPVRPNAVAGYTCNLETRGMNAEAIFSALDVEERRIVGPNGETMIGSAAFGKRVGDLECSRTMPVTLNASTRFSCAKVATRARTVPGLESNDPTPITPPADSSGGAEAI